MEWIPSLVGTAVGGLLSIAGSFAGWRWGRSERTYERQREELLPVAAKFLTATRKAWEEQNVFRSLSQRLLDRSKQTEVDDAVWQQVEWDRNKALVAHDEAIREARLINEELYLLNPLTKVQADRLFEAVWLFGENYSFRNSERASSAETQEYENARRDFSKAIRDNLSET